MNIKKNDNVVMLQGKDRGKQGKVLSVIKTDAGLRVVIEKLNVIKRHQKARKQGQTGQIINKERAVDISNVQLVCPKCSKPTRVARKLVGDNKIRVCKKCDSEI